MFSRCTSPVVIYNPFPGVSHCIVVELCTTLIFSGFRIGPFAGTGALPRTGDLYWAIFRRPAQNFPHFSPKSATPADIGRKGPAGGPLRAGGGQSPALLSVGKLCRLVTARVEMAGSRLCGPVSGVCPLAGPV